MFVMPSLTYHGLLFWKEYWKLVEPTSHGTACHCIVHLPSPDVAMSRSPVLHSGHSSATIAYATVSGTGRVPMPGPVPCRATHVPQGEESLYCGLFRATK